jgi:two-component system capsular synthesis response regulator RcsB
MRIRVILADDHPLILLGARQLLLAESRIGVLASATSPDTLLELLAGTACDVLVTDFSMPSERSPDGLAMLTMLRNRHPEVRVVVLTMLDNIGLLQSIRKAGVLGVLNKRGDMAELPGAIYAAYQKRVFLGTTVRSEMIAAGMTPADDAVQALSPKELEVVRLYAGGMSITDISKFLSRSVNTVSTQKHSALRKLGLKSDAELYQYAVQAGLT